MPRAAAPSGGGRTRPKPAPTTEGRFVHETDTKNVPRIKEKGVEARPDRADPEGRPGVFTHDLNDAEVQRRVENLPQGRSLLELDLDPRDVRGRGTGGSPTARFPNSVPPERVRVLRENTTGGLGRLADLVRGQMQAVGYDDNGDPSMRNYDEWVRWQQRHGHSPQGAREIYDQTVRDLNPDQGGDWSYQPAKAQADPSTDTGNWLWGGEQSLLGYHPNLDPRVWIENAMPGPSAETAGPAGAAAGTAGLWSLLSNPALLFGGI